MGERGEPVFALVAKARQFTDIRRAAEAVPLLLRALAAQPEHVAARCELSRAFLELGDGKRALREAERVAAQAPVDEWAHRLRAKALGALGKRREAIAAAREAARLDPEERQTLFTLGEALLLGGKRAEAQQLAERLLDLDPAWPPTHHLAGRVALRGKRWADAEQSFRRELELNPLSSTAMNNLGVALQRQGRKKEAIERYHDAARLAPADSRFQRNLERSVTAYVGGGLVLVWLGLQLVRILGADLGPGHPWLSALAVLPLGGVVVFLWLRRRKRLQELHPTVRRFYADEKKRERRVLFAAVLFLGSFPLALLWTLIILFSANYRSAAHPASWFFYVLVLAVAIVTTWRVVPQAIARRRQG